MKRIVALLLLLLCTGCTLRQEQLDGYFLSLVEQADEFGEFRLIEGSDGHWYLGTWDRDMEAFELEQWRMWQLDYEQHALILQPCAEFELTVEVVQQSPTKLRCHLTNTREDRGKITYGSVEGLEVKLDGEWYDLPDLCLSSWQATENIAFGETATVEYEPQLVDALTLPAGTYRVTQILRYNKQTVYATAEFEITDAS